jgi:hypothetical protein
MKDLALRIMYNVETSRDYHSPQQKTPAANEEWFIRLKTRR